MTEVTCEIFKCIHNDETGVCLREDLRINWLKQCDDCYIPEQD